MINKYTDPIITNYRFDKVGSRASVPITESLTINNGFLFLKEIPDRNNVVTIGNLVEVQKPEELDSETKFYIDYNAGIVYFDSKLNGTKVNVEYSGIGIVYYPASRIYLEVDENHEIIRTLSDIEGQLSSLTNLKNQQERLKQEIEERNGNLNKTIEEAKKIDLSGSVDKAKQAKTDLESTTRKASIADANLRADIKLAKGARLDLKKQEELSGLEIQKSVDLANTAKTSLDGSIASADDKINKVNEKSKEITSKINEANETQEKLTNTKNEITTSISDYDKKSAEIKQSAGEIDSKNNELKSTIARADELNTTLNSTIEESKKSNTTLSGTVEESKTKNTELSSSIDTASDLKGQLDTKNKEASDNITSLSSKISEGTQLKNELDTSTTNANQTNTELKDTTNKANLSKTQLDESKTSADELNKNLFSNKNELTALDNSLKAENEKATKNISDLDSKSTSGKQVIEDLSSATLKSETAKTNLDESNTKAIQTNTDLKATTQTANEAKTSLEQLKNESSTLSSELSKGNTTASLNIESLNSENQSAKTNIAGLQTENQNALSKQETLSSETAKANEAITRIAELITSSTDLKNKLEQIVASGDLDKYITDPKLREILTAYATKDDLSKIDVTSQLADYAKTANVNEQIQSLTALLDNKVDKVEGYGLSKNDYDDAEKEKLNSSIRKIEFYARPKTNRANLRCIDNTGNVTDVGLPMAQGYFSGLMSSQDKLKLDNIEPRANKVTSLSQLTDDETHRLVTDEEKNKWNSPPKPDLTDYAKKEELSNYKLEDGTIKNYNAIVDFNKNVDSDDVETCIVKTKINNGSTSNYLVKTYKTKYLTIQIAYRLEDVFEVYVRLGQGDRWDDWTELKASEELSNFREYIEQDLIPQLVKKDQLPSSLSQLTNDTKFKTETEVQEMIANSSKLKKEVVASLPSTGKDDVIYLVKDDKGKDNNSYLEYLWLNGKYELIGSTQVDLSGYVQQEELKQYENAIYALQTDMYETDSALSEKLDKKNDKALVVANIDWENEKTYTTPKFVANAVSALTSEIIAEFDKYVIDELQETLKKTDLSPFTLQELEEAFK